MDFLERWHIRKKKRAEGLQEIIDAHEEIETIFNKQFELSNMSKRYYKKQLGKLTQIDYYKGNLHDLDYRIQIFNCSFEEAKEFSKLPLYKKMIKYVMM